MICPFCSQATKIYNSRSSKERLQTWRRHRCKVCQTSFTTRERIDWDGTIEVKTKESTTPYASSRLLSSLLRANDSPILPHETIIELRDTIEYKLAQNHVYKQRIVSASLIASYAVEVLAHFSLTLALQYLQNVHRGNPPLKLVQELLAR